LVKGVKENIADGKKKDVAMVFVENETPSKRQRLEDWERQGIYFPCTKEEKHCDPLVLEAFVGSLRTQKAYIDTEAATEIMFAKYFNLLSSEERSMLQPAEAAIKGIADIPIKPLGEIVLYVTFSDGRMQRTDH